MEKKRGKEKTRLVLGWVGVGYLECWTVQPPSRAQHVPPPGPQNSPIRPAAPVSAASPYPHRQILLEFRRSGRPLVGTARPAHLRSPPPVVAREASPGESAVRHPPPRRRRLYQGEDPYELVGCEFI
ncbi:hypothetical protein VPH35_119925 [Triticum aestivum]